MGADKGIFSRPPLSSPLNSSTLPCSPPLSSPVLFSTLLPSLPLSSPLLYSPFLSSPLTPLLSSTLLPSPPLSSPLLSSCPYLILSVKQYRVPYCRSLLNLLYNPLPTRPYLMYSQPAWQVLKGEGGIWALESAWGARARKVNPMVSLSNDNFSS